MKNYAEADEIFTAHTHTHLEDRRESRPPKKLNMIHRSFISGAVAGWLLLGVIAAVGAEESKPLRVLFVGNSLTWFPGCDVPKTVAALVNANPAHRRIETALAEKIAGQTLQLHWESGEVQKRLKSERWDYVVIQGQSGEVLYDNQGMREYGKKLAEVVKAAGAKPVFYMLWERRDLPGTFEQIIRPTYTEMARDNEAGLAPVGAAWMESLKLQPKLALHRPDGNHSNDTGRYLTACVFYALFTGERPQGLAGAAGLSRLPSGVSAFLEERAWEAAKEHLVEQSVAQSASVPASTPTVTPAIAVAPTQSVNLPVLRNNRIVLRVRTAPKIVVRTR